MPARSDQATIDRNPFYGSKVPPSIAALKKSASKLDKSTFQKILRMAVSTLEQKPIQHAMFEGLTSADLPLETVHIVYAGTLKLLQCAFRLNSSSFTKDMFLSDMTYLSLPKEMVDDLSSAVFGSRKGAIESSVTENRPRLPTIRTVQWKIDVAISTTSLSRVLEPVVHMQLNLSTGETKKFEMSVAKFQELRYNVASVLTEMESLEKRGILKVHD